MTPSTPETIGPERFDFKPRKMSAKAKPVFTRQRCADCPHLEVLSVNYSKFFVCVRSDQEVGQYDYCLLGFKR